MKTVVKMFKPQFAELVRTGKKLQTIRPTPKRMPKVGDMVSLRCWADKPYRSKHVLLGDGRITGVSMVDITENGIVVNSYSEPCDDIARADGFENFFEMREWFEQEHGLPFQGILIRWELFAERQRSMMSDKTDIQTEDEGAVANSSNRLVRRFGWQRVFRAADKVEAVRRSDWYRWCVANPHPSGSPGIYRPDAIKMARRAAHAHQIASDIFHEFILPNANMEARRQ